MEVRYEYDSVVDQKNNNNNKEKKLHDQYSLIHSFEAVLLIKSTQKTGTVSV